MPDNVDDIAAYYDADPDLEHERLSRQQLEYELTSRFLTEHLPASGSVLDVGAGTGRYAVELARRGYDVTAVDLSEALIRRARALAAEEGLTDRVRFLVGDARELDGLQGPNQFDAVLMLGPLYHLVAALDREAALGQAFARLRSGGLIFSAFLSRFGVLGDLMKRVPEWIHEQAKVESLLTRGSRPSSAPKGGFRGYFATVEEIRPLHEKVGFESVDLVGVEPVISADDESFNRLSGDRRTLWLDLLQEVGGEPSILGASRHILYIGRRPDPGRLEREVHDR